MREAKLIRCVNKGKDIIYGGKYIGTKKFMKNYNKIYKTISEIIYD